jgi:hypothetical protein
MSNLGKMSSGWHVAGIWELRNAQDLSQKHRREETTGKEWEGSNKTRLRAMWLESVEWIN